VSVAIDTEDIFRNSTLLFGEMSLTLWKSARLV